MPARGASRYSSRNLCVQIVFTGWGGDKRGQRATGPPDQIVGEYVDSECQSHTQNVSEIGTFVHAVEDEMFCSSVLTDRVPHFNAPVYLQNKSMIGKIDEILGPINEVYFSVKMNDGMVASSFKKGDTVYIGGDKLLPIERFLPKPKKILAGWLKIFNVFLMTHATKIQAESLVWSLICQSNGCLICIRARARHEQRPWWKGSRK